MCFSKYEEYGPWNKRTKINMQIKNNSTRLKVGKMKTDITLKI